MKELIFENRPNSSNAIRSRVQEITREELARAMEEGYQQETQSPSLDAEWTLIEAGRF